MFINTRSFVSVVIAITLAHGAAARSGGYDDTCAPCVFGGANTYGTPVNLTCFCKPDGVRTFIDLDLCFANQGGTVVEQINGQFGANCAVWGMNNGIGDFLGMMMTTCEGQKGKDPVPMNLNEWIGNIDGKLVC